MKSRIPVLEGDTKEATEKWIKVMYEKGLLFHFDDNPREVCTYDGSNLIPVFTEEECKDLDIILDKLDNVEDIDIFEVALELEGVSVD